ncbi:hypothetical protein HW130_05020 [Streptomyces sp. PKU-EA00015]|nr:hypothetical protein [Streptomyces sp. PKU-EA00015]
MERPDTRSCQVTVAQARFRDFTPYRGALRAARGLRHPPPATAGRCPQSKVVLRLEGSVKGRQYDRLGHLAIGGIEILRT